jgi:hypothetical protein
MMGGNASMRMEERLMNRFFRFQMIVLLAGLAVSGVFAEEPAWNPAALKECDRACLIAIMDGYMNALYNHAPKTVPPLAIDVRMTENTGILDVGEGMLWRSKVEPTSFRVYIADPVSGQVAQQARLKIGDRMPWYIH